MVRWGQGQRGKEARHLARSTGRRCSGKEEEAERERNDVLKTGSWRLTLLPLWIRAGLGLGLGRIQVPNNIK